MEQKETLCDEVETVREFTYLGDWVSARGGYEAAVPARARCGWFKLRGCGELLYGRFPLKLKMAVYRSYVRSPILYGNETLCLKKQDWSFMKNVEIHDEDNMCSACQRWEKTFLVMGLNETSDQLDMENSVLWYGHVLNRKDGHVLRRALDSEVEGQRKKEKLKRTWKKQVEEKIVKVGLRRDDVQIGVLA